MMAVTKLMVLTRTVAWLSALIIIVLSVVADNMRPRVMADDRCEHFAAYFIAGSLLAISYSRPRQLLSNGIVLAICAGVLEIAQSWIPGPDVERRRFRGEYVRCLDRHRPHRRSQTGTGQHCCRFSTEMDGLIRVPDGKTNFV